MKAVYRIAGKNIELDSIYDRVHNYCREYLTDNEPDISFTVTQADIDNERERSTAAASDSYLEELAVYRKISEQMPYYNTFLFHGSCIAVDGTGYLFSAVSGTGKSTHSRLWRELLGDKAVMVNDDKPLICVENGQVTVFGTPYNGKHRLGSNISVPLGGLALLERAENNTVIRVGAEEIYSKLLQQMYRPSDPTALALSLSLLDQMLKLVPLYRLGVNMDISAAKTAYEAMKI